MSIFTGRNVIVFVLVLVILGNFFISTNYVKELKMENARANKYYNAKILEYKKDSVESRSYRDSLSTRNDILRDDNEILMGAVIEKAKELAAVKGRYVQHTPGEIESELMRRYKEGK
jgi:hypothetical protein